MMGKRNILELSDDILLKILSFLKSRDLLKVNETCKRLQQVSSDKSLWKDADFKPYCLCLRSLKKATSFFHRGTKSLKIKGFRKTKTSQQQRYMSLSVVLLKIIAKKCPRLNVFELTHHYINAAKLPITAFPSSVENLWIRYSEILNPPERRSYFHDISIIMPNITYLNLEGSLMDDSALMPISKLPMLKTLILLKCREMGSCIAYVAISTFGFTSLEVLDARLTKFHDSTCHGLRKLKGLKELYIDGDYLKKSNQSLDCISDRLAMSYRDGPSELNVLHLKNSEVTDVTLGLVPRSFPLLKELNLQGSKVTERGIIELKLKAPFITVFSDFGKF